MFVHARAGHKPEVVGKALRLRNGTSMPLLAFGTWRVDKEKCSDLVYEAIKQGCRHIDTAQIYFNQEETGQGIQRAITEGLVKREELWVTSKVWADDFQPKKMKAAVQKLLTETGLQYLDLVLLHWPYYVPATEGNFFSPGERDNRCVDFSVPRYATYKALEECQKEGSAKSIGVSNYTQEHLAEILSQCEVPPVTNQIEFHLFLQSWNLYEYCKDYNMCLTAYSALGYYNNDKPSPLKDEKVAEIGVKYGKTNAHICLRYLIQNEIPTIFKSNNRDHLEANLQVFDFEIQEDDMKVLKDMQARKVRCLNPFPDYLHETRAL